MKFVAKLLPGWACIWVMAYISGSFISAGFDINQWSIEARVFVAVSALVSCMLSYFFVHSNELSDREIKNLLKEANFPEGKE